jgi:hypothetical protein
VQLCFFFFPPFGFFSPGVVGFGECTDKVKQPSSRLLHRRFSSDRSGVESGITGGECEFSVPNEGVLTQSLLTFFPSCPKFLTTLSRRFIFSFLVLPFFFPSKMWKSTFCVMTTSCSGRCLVGVCVSMTTVSPQSEAPNRIAALSPSSLLVVGFISLQWFPPLSRSVQRPHLPHPEERV